MLNEITKKIKLFFWPEEKNRPYIFLFIFLFELFSFAAFLIPAFRNPAFIIISLIAVLITLFKPDLGLLFLFAELFIGSKGYLFYFEHAGVVLPIRIVLWLAVMSVWLAKFITKSFREKKLSGQFFGKPVSGYFYVCFAFIAWGLINGLLNSRNFGDIFFDFNGWLFFALVFPLYDQLKNNDFYERLKDVFWVCLGWLIVKTYIVLFIFSHSAFFASDVYRWIRTSGVGEITRMEGGFFRIFFQSHIFLLVGFFILLSYFSNEIKNKNFNNKKNSAFFLFFCFIASGILISLSRSYWAGLAAGLIMFFAYLIWKKIGISNIFRIMGALATVLIISFLLIGGIVKFPFPSPKNKIDAGGIFTKRISELSGESAISSRWSLLPPLWSEIIKHPIVGSGFGATITYKSNDPRVLETNPKGEYTTYAFEWAWLDIWLKLGILGLLSYILLLGKITLESIKKSDKVLMSGLIIGLAALITTNIFTPYLNHPLGIGCVLLISFLVIKKD